MDSLLMIDYEIITPTIDDGYIIDNYQYDAVVTADENRRCQQSLEQQSLASAHEQSSLTANSFVCPVCLKQFAQLCNLKQHLRIHSGDRPYACVTCSKTFKQQGHLQTHQRAIHTGERPFTCPVETCSGSFHQLGNLRQHLRSCHVTPTKMHQHSLPSLKYVKNHFYCAICSCQCSSLAVLKSHFIKIHSSRNQSTPIVVDNKMNERQILVVNEVASTSDDRQQFEADQLMTSNVYHVS